MSLVPSLPRSLVGRITLWAVLLLIVAVLLFWALFSVAAREVSTQVVDTRLVQFADQVRGYWVSRRAGGAPNGGPNEAPPRGAERGGEQPAIAPNPTPVPGNPDVGWVWQISEGGRVVERSQLLQLTGAGIVPSVTEIGEAFAVGYRDTPIGPMRIAERIVDESSAGGEAAPVHYLIGISAEQYADYVEQHVARLRQLFLLALIPVSLAVFGMLAVIVLALRRDLGRLASAIGRYEAADTPEIEGRFPGELQRLVDRVNTLLHQNVMLIDRTRKYVSKIAHDINHPLAVLKNGLSADKTDAELLKRQVDRMAGLVDRYASLARAIGPDSDVQRRTDVADLLNDIADGFGIMYRRTPLEITCTCAPGLSFPVARHDLEAIASNLVSNAHKFAEARVEIGARIEAGEQGDELIVWVEDDGPGISPEQRDAALNWGGRLDEAPPGTGFGLSIVADIAALYDGKLALEDSALGGLRVTVAIPQSSEQRTPTV